MYTCHVHVYATIKKYIYTCREINVIPLPDDYQSKYVVSK